MKTLEANVAIPDTCFLHQLTKLHGRQVWKNGNHMGSFDPFDKKKLIGKAVNGRTIDE